ncbi:PAS domain-containing protein [bacterium]|nr:PAS domain-containing protein [bacterium]
MSPHPGKRFASILTVLMCLAALSAQAHLENKNVLTARNVLILNSYHYGYSQSDIVVSTIFQRMQRETPPIDIHVEYMDTKRYSDERSIQRFQNFLLGKYTHQTFDLIIAADDYAFGFMRALQKEIWQGIPVVFCGVNHYDPSMLEGVSNYTGVVEKSDIEGNIRLIQKFHPEAHELYIINDNSLTGKSVRAGEGKIIENMLSDWTIHYFEGDRMDLDSLLSALAQVPESAVVIYQAWLRDKSGRTYKHKDVLPLIAAHSAAPVYGFSDVYMGFGIVGGNLVSGVSQGNITADMALRILRGESPSGIPVQTDCECAVRFDDRQLKRFGISEKLLPPGSMIVGKPVPFLEKHRSVIWTSLIVVVIQTILIVFLLLNRMWRQKIEDALKTEHRLLASLMDNMPDFIYFKDKESRFIRNNRAHLALFRLNRQEDTLGKTNFDFFAREFAQETLEDERRIIETGQPIIDKIEDISHMKGAPTWVTTTKVPVIDESGQVTTIIGISRDITDRILASEQIKASLDEKEVLLKEIHHRVKNNLQVISSLLNLQSSYINDPDTLNIFRESQNRVRSMALIHENLYKSRDISRLDLDDYLKTLILGLNRSYQDTNGHIEFDLHVEDIPLNVDKAVPCGLIINELVSNCLKYAFPKNKKDARISIDLSMQDDHVIVCVRDNGKGMPENFNWDEADSLGLKLVRILATRQLDGEIQYSGKNGTLFRISFPIHAEPDKKSG